MAGYAAGQVVRLGGNLVLTRLLFPEVFGQMALVTIFIQGLAMFSDVGTGPAIVQSVRGDDPRFLNTAWTIQCGRGVLLWLASWVIAAPVARFYAQPLLTWLIPAAALSAILGGFEATAVHSLQRHLQLGRLTLVELAGQVVGTIGTVVLAALDRWQFGANHPGAVWAIIGGGLLASATRLVLSHTALPGIRNRFLLDRESMHQLFSFGRWIFVSTLLTFLAAQSDRLIFGKLIPLDLFGVYGIAVMLAALPTEAVLKLGGSVVFPAYSRLAQRPDFRRLLDRVRLPLLVGSGLIVSGLLAGGPFLIRILYDRRYLEAGWILQFLSAMAWFKILECTNGQALLAKGHVRWVAAGSGAKLAGLVVLVPLGFHLSGFAGALGGLVLSEVVKYLTSAAGMAASGLSGLARDAAFTAAVALVSWVGILSGRVLGDALQSSLAGLVGAGLVALCAWAGIAVWTGLLRRPAPLEAGGVA
jgi:O-antigen/teichoic acid export membrane protein